MTTITINRRVLNAVSMFASTEITRYCLVGVCVEVDAEATRYTATDGYTLAHYIEPHGDCFDKSVIGFRCTVPIALAKKLSKREIDFGFLHFEDGATSIKDACGNLNKSTNDMGTYPDYWLAVPDMCEGEPAQFHWTYMAKFAKFADILGLSSPFIHHAGIGNEAAVTFGESTTAFGVIMPYRADSPAWNKRAFMPAA